VARYMYGKMLDFTPGTNSRYSNYGYLLAGAVVEHVTSMKYFDYVKEMMLQPASQRNGREAICEDQGLSPIDLNSQFLVPAVYGGNGEIREAAHQQLAIFHSSFTTAIYRGEWPNDKHKPLVEFGSL